MPDVELEQAVGAPAPEPVVTDSPVPVRVQPMSFEQKITLTVLGIVSTAFMTLMGFVIKRRSKENNAEDWAWSANQKTIRRLEQELEASRKEVDTLRTTRNDFEIAQRRAVADLEIARNAASTAAAALARNVADLQALQLNWERAQRYIRVLRDSLARNNIEIPTEPEV